MHSLVSEVGLVHDTSFPLKTNLSGVKLFHLREQNMKLLQSLCRSDLQSSLDKCPAAVHEYRIPPKALFGLHSYCPVYFDALHAVLIDTSVHISLLRAGYHTPRLKVPRFVKVHFLKISNRYIVTVACP